MAKKLPKVLVIMSTYNGEKYLKEQIESILHQKNVELVLHVFDDVSSDSTIEIVRQYMKEFKNIKLTVNEKNKNFTYNFLDALFSYKDNKKFDYYAFADQDDYWCDNKIISAIKKIKEKGECTLYSSNLKVVNEDLKYCGNNMLDTNYINKYYDILCKNIVTGCTIVMDTSFKDFATQYYPNNIYLHDHWLAIIANYCTDANFVYDSCSDHILYRQHGDNLIGKNNGLIKKLRKKDFFKSTYYLICQFVELYSENILDADKLVFDKLVNYKKFKNKLWLIFNIKSTFKFIFIMKLILKNY